MIATTMTPLVGAESAKLHVGIPPDTVEGRLHVEKLSWTVTMAVALLAEHTKAAAPQQNFNVDV